MNLAQVPWLELALVFSLLGGIWISQMREAHRAARASLVFTGAVLFLSIMASAVFLLGFVATSSQGMQIKLFGRNVFEIDALSAPLVPAVALLHFLTSLATARTKMRRFSFSWSLVAESIRLATFSCKEPRTLIALLIISVIP